MNEYEQAFNRLKSTLITEGYSYNDNLSDIAIVESALKYTPLLLILKPYITLKPKVNGFYVDYFIKIGDSELPVSRDDYFLVKELLNVS